MALLSTLQDLVVHLVEPWLLMAVSLRHVPQTVRALLSEGQPAALLSPAAFSEALFGHFWATVGPDVRRASEEHVVPLLEGRVANGRVHPSVVAVPVHGTVVEIGAGSGMWVDVFARIRAGEGPPPPDRDDDDGLRSRARRDRAVPITNIYGVEPNPRSAAALRRRVRQVGLDDVYHVVPVGIESVSDPLAWAGRIPPGSVDCIVGVLCLCSIPNPEDNIRRLHGLLKPGGRWYVYEHVKATRGGPLLRLYQREQTRPPSYLCATNCCLTTRPL